MGEATSPAAVALLAMNDVDPPVQTPSAPRRYEVLMKLAAGGMATVYIGYLRGGLGFRQVVAIKRPHRHLIEDPRFRDTFVSEAYLASRLHHTNVVDVRDVDVASDSVDLVMDYVEGASLSRLLEACRRKKATMPPAIALRIMVDACMGLDAAHELTDEAGAALGLVHRDVSPQNILVGLDGVTRVTDFGIAKCMSGGDVSTQGGVLKGKLGYMAPEYISKQRYDRRADIFALGVVFWESLTMRRLFTGRRQIDTVRNILEAPAERLDEIGQPLGKRLDEVLEYVLHKDPEARFERSVAFAAALENIAIQGGLNLSHRSVASFVQEMVGEELEATRLELRERLGSRASRVPDAPSVKPSAMPSAPALAAAPTPGSASRSSPGDRPSASRSSAQSVRTQTERVQLPMHGSRVGWVLAAVLLTAVVATTSFIVAFKVGSRNAAGRSSTAATAVNTAPAGSPLSSATMPTTAPTLSADAASAASQPLPTKRPNAAPSSPSEAPRPNAAAPSLDPYHP